MNQEIKAKWLAALRSGKYRQGSSFLKVNGENGARDRFCCLGVLCELAVEAGVTERLRERYETTYGLPGDTSAAVLPLHVQQWSGVYSQAGNYDGGHKTLTGANDGGISFVDIADIIEHNF